MQQTLMLTLHCTANTVLLCTLPPERRTCEQFSAGEGFTSWGQMSHLTSMSLQNAWRIQDQGVQVLGGCLTALRSLNLKGCRNVTDHGLADLAPLSQLTHLSLQVRQAVNWLQLTELSATGLYSPWSET